MAARLDLEISPIKFRNPVQEAAFGGAAIAVDMMRHVAVADIMRDKKPLPVERATGLSCPVDSSPRLFQSLSSAICRFGTHAVDVLSCINGNDE
jgi:hypothetical protein